MTEAKYYSLEKDGTYCLGFPNKHALSEKEIEEIFSDYGDVISVRTSGDERGFRFVRFKSEEEAECAVQGLHGHKKIRILPKKPKVANNNEKGRSKENQKNGQQKNLGAKKKVSNKNKKKDDDELNDSFNEDSPTAHSINKKKPQPYGGTYNGSFNAKSFDSTNEEDSAKSAETENLMKILKFRSLKIKANNCAIDSFANAHEEGTKKKINQNEEEGSNRDNSNSRQLGNNVKPKTQHKEVDESVKSNPEENGNVLKKIRLNASQLHSGRQSTDSVSRFATDQIACDLSDDKEPPELVSTDELKQRSGKGSVCSDETIKISLAEEVIVANIHEKFSVLYILYLLEKFEPISITEIKTISRNGVRYCSVYFKSQKDAIAVERQFDNFDLSGNKLIVRTPQLLVKEVSTV